MTVVSIVYHRHHRATREYAQLLADRLHVTGHAPQLVAVSEASPHEVVYSGALVLLSPVMFGRIHGAALARIIAGVRPTAVLVVGDARLRGRVSRLFSAEQLRNITVFSAAGRDPQVSEVVPVADWVSGLPGAPTGLLDDR